jgi:GNAT superfamily N-acetyltransferase
MVNEKDSQMDPKIAGLLHVNHIDFLSTHRGLVGRLHDGFTVESEHPDFHFAALGPESDASVLDRFSTVHLVPWSGAWGRALGDERFQPQGGTSYMTFTGTFASPKPNPAVQTLRVTNEAEMDAFSHVQATGFTRSRAEYDRWHPWFRGMNRRNKDLVRQGFYVGYDGDHAAGAALLVMTAKVAGIYEVTTLPNHRKRGVASALLARAVADAAESGIDLIHIQAPAGSKAEAFCAKLGFRTEFRSAILSR